MMGRHLSAGVSALWLVASFAGGQTIGEQTKDPPLSHSKAVQVGGAEFELVARTHWERPAKVYDVCPANVGLRIRNKTDKDLIFDLGDRLRINLIATDGGDLAGTPVPKRFFNKPLNVKAGQTETVMLPTHLFFTRIGDVCLGLDSGAGWNWLTGEVGEGKYRLRLSFENKREGGDLWMGAMQTETLEVEVRAAPRKSN